MSNKEPDYVYILTCSTFGRLKLQESQFSRAYQGANYLSYYGNVIDIIEKGRKDYVVWKRIVPKFVCLQDNR